MGQLLKNRFVRAIFVSALFLQVGIWVRKLCSSFIRYGEN